MKRPSQKTWELIQELYTGPRPWQKLIGDRDSQVRALEEIALSNEALAAPHLTSGMLKPSEVREFEFCLNTYK
jgi:hypothetical protein